MLQKSSQACTVPPSWEGGIKDPWKRKGKIKACTLRPYLGSTAACSLEELLVEPQDRRGLAVLVVVATSMAVVAVTDGVDFIDDSRSNVRALRLRRGGYCILAAMPKG
jgi:hypothetical protein